MGRVLPGHGPKRGQQRQSGLRRTAYRAFAHLDLRGQGPIRRRGSCDAGADPAQCPHGSLSGQGPFGNRALPADQRPPDPEHPAVRGPDQHRRAGAYPARFPPALCGFPADYHARGTGIRDRFRSGPDGAGPASETGLCRYRLQRSGPVFSGFWRKAVLYGADFGTWRGFGVQSGLNCPEKGSSRRHKTLPCCKAFFAAGFSFRLRLRGII